MPVLVQTSLKRLESCLYRSSRRHVPTYQTSTQQVTFFHLNIPTSTKNHSTAIRTCWLHWVTGLPHMWTHTKSEPPQRIPKQMWISFIITPNFFYTYTMFSYIHDWPIVTFPVRTQYKWVGLLIRNYSHFNYKVLAFKKDLVAMNTEIQEIRLHLHPWSQLCVCPLTLSIPDLQ